MTRRKLPNGAGSIAKLGKVGKYKRVSPYMVRLPAYYDENMKEKRKVIGCFKTYKEAYQALIQYVPDQNEKIETFEDVYRFWKKTNEFTKLTKNTQNRYERSFEHFESLHNKPLKDIKYYMLQRIVDDTEADGYEKTDKNGKKKHCKYSKSSIMRLKHMLSKIYTYAIKNEIVTNNISTLITVGGLGVRREKEIFTKEEIEKLFLSINKCPFARHILILIFTGMRTGEYYDLETKNINLTQNKIVNFGEKTDAGKSRTMFIHPKINKILTNLVSESKTGYIYEKNQKHASSTVFYKEYYRTLEKLNIKEKIPYSCRYTFATIAHNSGVDDKTLQSLMGHTNFNVTANAYIQDLDEFTFKELQKIII